MDDKIRKKSAKKIGRFLIQKISIWRDNEIYLWNQLGFAPLISLQTPVKRSVIWTSRLVCSQSRTSSARSCSSSSCMGEMAMGSTPPPPGWTQKALWEREGRQSPKQPTKENNQIEQNIFKIFAWHVLFCQSDSPLSITPTPTSLIKMQVLVTRQPAWALGAS